MSADTAPAAPPAAGAPTRLRSRRDLEGPPADLLERRALHLADGMRRDARTCNRFERRMHVLDLLHRDPQLLAELVLALAETAALPPRR